MESFFQVVKKLAGAAHGTAAWATNVGNEHGQVLISVLTTEEGKGLGNMCAGLVGRYQTANQSPPQILYVDRDCCAKKGNTHFHEMFKGLPDLAVRLDIWHFMRRLAAGCTTESHPLYGVFMSRLSSCIFEWNKDDVFKLKDAKIKQLYGVDYFNVDDKLTKEEMALHCRRRTRGAEVTTKMIENLIIKFTGEAGKDSLGVPVLDQERIWLIWETQKRHVVCIQDPPEFQLYTQTGTLKKGGIELPTYRCARGSTSLESFHQHLKTFIPGKYHFSIIAHLLNLEKNLY